MMNTKPRNVLGTALVPCSYAPLTGYFRDGCWAPVVLESTHVKALEFVTLAELQSCA
jgi:uncharacterized protein (DUF2237 family)